MCMSCLLKPQRGFSRLPFMNIITLCLLISCFSRSSSVGPPAVADAGGGALPLFAAFWCCFTLAVNWPTSAPSTLSTTLPNLNNNIVGAASILYCRETSAKSSASQQQNLTADFRNSSCLANSSSTSLMWEHWSAHLAEKCTTTKLPPLQRKRT